MKKSLLTISASILLIIISCSKNHDSQPELQIDEKNLTDCPNGAVCTYWFIENDILSPNAPYGNSDARIFFAQATNSIGGVTLSIEAPRQVNSFSLTDEDIKNGKVKFGNNCPACNTIGYKIIGGSVKGINLSSRDTRPSGSVKWLVEAKIIREIIGIPAAIDTVSVKQYFYPISYY